MNETTSIVVIAITAVLIQNFIFSRFLGICPFLGVSNNPKNAFGMGMAVTFCITVASVATYALNTYVLVPYKLEYLQTIGFILIIASLVQLIEMFLRRFIPALYNALGIYLPLITTNCAVLGACLLNIQYGFGFIQSVAFGFFSAIGFTLALLVMAGVRARLVLATPPKAFEGMPLVLVTAALIAMAFSGFQGLKL
jgi:electron transport complex protein RnfA